MSWRWWDGRERYVPAMRVPGASGRMGPLPPVLLCPPPPVCRRVLPVSKSQRGVCPITQSLPSSQTSRFQMGTCSLIRSMT